MNIFLENELRGLIDFNIFIVKVYIKNWFLCQIATYAPRNDLEFIKQLLEYKKVNLVISNAAVSTFLRHTWYLSEVMVGLAFFDRNIGYERKTAMVAGLKREANIENRIKANISIGNINDLEIDTFVSKQTSRFFIYFLEKILLIFLKKIQILGMKMMNISKPRKL